MSVRYLNVSKWIWLFVATLILLEASAFGQSATQHQEGALDAVITNFHNATQTWEAKLQGYANSLLFLLATISLAWQGIQVALKRSDWNDVLREVIMLVMTVGFYFFLIANMGWITQTLLDSFETIAVGMIPSGNAIASGTGLQLSPSAVINMGLDIYTMMGNQATGFSQMGTDIVLTLIGLVIAILFAGIAAYLVLVLCEGFVVSTAGVVFLGFAGIDFTIDIAKNYLRYLLSFAVKLFAVYVILAIGMTILEVQVIDKFAEIRAEELSWTERQGKLMIAAFWAIVVPLVMLVLSFMVPAVMVQIVGGMGSHSNFALNSVLTTTLMTASSVGMKAASAAGVGGMGAAVGGAGMHQAGMQAMQSMPMIGAHASLGAKAGSYASGAAGALKGAMGAGASAVGAGMDQKFKDFGMNHGDFMKGATGAMFPQWNQGGGGDSGSSGDGGSAGGK